MKNNAYLADQMALVPADQREAVRHHAANIIATSRLTRLRESIHLTQQQVAVKMAVKQAAISQIEGRDDLRLSTLMRYVTALGGRLSIRVTMPDGAEHDLATSPQDFPNSSEPQVKS